MSKELIEKLREDGKFLGGNFGKLMQEAADALEAKASTVGEREAFEAHVRIGGYSNPDKHPDGSYVSSVMELWWQGWKAGAAYQRAQQPQATDWKASGADWCSSIHRNPDAKAWADFFVATFPGLADKHDLMLGWFANAMMAMHDYLKAQQPQSAEAVGWQQRYLDPEEGPSMWQSCDMQTMRLLKDRSDYEVRPVFAAPQPSAGVVMPESVGVLILGGLVHGWSGPELGDIDIDPNMRVLERIQMELVTSSDDVHLELFARLNGKEVV